eukprot:MONOS_2129.1-p1 / transcript=MONOS_2129.1 / gene=MONOS_2129 / organism=Monocercomonoides_exilis_PA203 / gene_product=unspecified product / transcript_product=unspecified product / location=Mono_scaffold00042:13669-15205(+) / protein_length=422 / sequence_SO=supercontig / SO=protein_coding / is_pseudo=false
MSSYNADGCTGAILELSRIEKFFEMFSELENDAEEGQKQKIEEINEILDEMDEAEFYSIFTKEMFEKIDQMIEKKKLTLENAILLLKHIGYHNVIVKFFKFDFHVSSLRFRIENMITEEEKKKEGKNEKPLVDLCECNLLLSNGFISEPIISVCVTYVLKVAMSKEEGEEARKDVEMALLALSNTMYYFIEQKLYLKEIKDIVQYHQEHHNLTRLAYQSTMQFLIHRLHNDKSLESLVVNELHFAREAARELDELTKCVDWERKCGEEGEKEKETEEIALMRWIKALKLKYSGLINSIVQLFRATKERFGEISDQCIYLLKTADDRDMKIDGLVKGGAIDLVLEEIQQPTLNKDKVKVYTSFLMNVSRRLKEKGDDEKKKVERKMLKRKVFEKMEEEGYENCVIGLCHHNTHLLEKTKKII